MKTKINRNTTLYLLQVLMAIGVIVIHIEKYNLNGFEVYLEALGKSTVLFFFAVSGVFYYKKNKNLSIHESYNSSFKKIKRLLIIAFIVIILTFLYKMIFECNCDMASILSMFKGHLNKNNIIRLLIFNRLSVATHLWFVFALIYVYLLAPIIIAKFKKRPNIVFILVIATLILVYIFTFFFHNSIDVSYRYMITRNWLFEGIPAFMIGVYLKENENRIKEYIKSIKKTRIIIIVLIVNILIFLDAYLSTIINVNFEFYLLSPLLVIILMSIVFAFPKNKIGEALQKVFGDKLSTIIYMFHPIVLLVLSKVFNRFLPNQNCYFYSLLLTIFAMLIISYLYNKTICMLKNKD